MTALHALDRRIGDAWPNLTSDADVRAFEAVPYAERIAAASTYEALRIGSMQSPDSPAIRLFRLLAVS